MFYALSIISMLGYAVQNALVAGQARQMDGFSFAFYRNALFIVTLLPLLLFGNVHDMIVVLNQWPLLLLAAVAGGTHLALTFAAYRFLPVSIVQAISRTGVTIWIAIGSYFLFQESIATAAIFLIAIVLAANIVLAMQRNPMDHIDQQTAWGIFLVCAASIPFAISALCFVVLSRNANPLVAGYFWEASIGVVLGLLVIVRKLMGHQGFQPVSMKKLGIIALVTWPTLIGTGALGLAQSMGPAGIVAAIASGGLIVMTLMAVWLYKEHLKPIQWMAIVVVALGIGALKFVS